MRYENIASSGFFSVPNLFKFYHGFLYARNFTSPLLKSKKNGRNILTLGKDFRYD